MEINPDKPSANVKHDEDISFERDKESALVPLTDTLDPVSPTAGETTLPDKEGTLGASDFKPLSAEEEIPKLNDEPPPNDADH